MVARGVDVMNENTHKVTGAHSGFMLNDIQYCTKSDESLRSIARNLGMDTDQGPVMLWLFNNEIYPGLVFPTPGYQCPRCFRAKTIVYVPQDVGKESRKRKFKAPISKNAEKSRRKQHRNQD